MRLLGVFLVILFLSANVFASEDGVTCQNKEKPLGLAVLKISKDRVFKKMRD
ncbi:MAG: hypothetical protein HQ462_01085 [Deltaproteobacteria bacterium]|nr:hypothetical protein [Deltaproteobacteria bacterium]